MYRLKDEVKFVKDGELMQERFEIIHVSDDEEIFDIKSIESDLEIYGATRDKIMEDWEVDKIVVALVNKNLVKVGSDELETDYTELIAPDTTIDGLAMNFNSFSTVDELYQWWKMYVDYIQYDIDSEMYHVVTKNV